jgi:hypothetical protein
MKSSQRRAAMVEWDRAQLSYAASLTPRAVVIFPIARRPVASRNAEGGSAQAATGESVAGRCFFVTKAALAVRPPVGLYY